MIEPVSDSDLESAYLSDERKAPWLYVNMVATIDGATTIDGRSTQIGDAQDTTVFRSLRAAADLILVAAATAREEEYKKPRLPGHLVEWRRDKGLADVPRVALVSSSLEFELSPFEDAPPIVVTDATASPVRRQELEAQTEVILAGVDRVDLRHAISHLRERGFGTILSEGGPSLNGQLAAEGLIDEWCLTVAPLVVGGDSKRVATGPSVSPDGRHYRLDRAMRGTTSLFTRWLRAAPGS